MRERDPLELRREVCLVPQLPALLEGTVEENIRFAADLAGREPDVARLLDLAGLDASFAGRDSGKLSVGEQQRAMLARSLALEPRVLLLDEPTSALDEGARGAVEATLLHLRERVKVSTVLVTHDLAQARRMADWVVRLDEGRLVAQGPVKEQLLRFERPRYGPIFPSGCGPSLRTYVRAPEASRAIGRRRAAGSSARTSRA